MSNSGSRSGSSAAAAAGSSSSQPPTSLSSPTTTTMPAQPVTAHAPPLQPTLPSAETQRRVAEARSAVVASLSNMVDSELQSRAGMLHDNAAALDKQEKDVLRATEGLRREREKLAREADVAAKRLKEVGNVQNWAEVLERGFLVLEETVRLANGGKEYDDNDDGEGSCSCSCSECGSVWSGSEAEAEAEAGEGIGSNEFGKDGGKRRSGDDERTGDADTDMAMGDTESGNGTWSDASKSLVEAESITGTGRAQGSETASTTTTM
ncbi:hypothetical protein S40288_03204 [Stachybotrys chartarum IBT 40288]|nr:hypothetical protein S40288_03204 [Stachybotrys chartarum IBT 40288]